MKHLLVLLLATMLAACGGGGGDGGSATGGGVQPSTQAFTLQTSAVATGLADPVFATAPAGDPRLFIVLRAGRIMILQRGAGLQAAPFLDLSARVSTAGEGGLLSMAFDPNHASNGFFYVYFVEPPGDIAVERFHVSANANIADPTPLRIITIPHRTFANHFGGLVRFGPDGFLYLGTGDGGGGGDPLGNGQNLNALLGKLLRLDVRNASAAAPYAIPPGNPFAGQANRRPEIWASGLRNPFRYAFDDTTNRLYIGDVGESRVEEVDVTSASSAGLNYGWNITEGSTCFLTAGCDRSGITLPVLEYGHDANGGCSVIGGFVYRGSAFPEIQGRYFYSDLCSGFLRSFVFNGGAATDPQQHIASMGTVVSFGEDGQKELYVITAAGEVLRINRVFQ